MKEAELWKDITDFEGIYQISSFGRVNSIERNANHCRGKRKVKQRIRKAHFSDKLGYLVITLKSQAKGIQRRCYVHRLVAEAFIPNPENKPEVNHIDSNRKNAKVNNLEWVTSSENKKHSYNTKNRVAFWVGKPTAISIPVIATSKTQTIEFRSASKCADFFGVCLNTIRKRMRQQETINGFIICPK